MKVREETLRWAVMVAASVVVAIYNIEYSLLPYPDTLLNYLKQLVCVSLVAYFGIFLVVLLPCGLLVGKLESMIDVPNLPITQRYTALSDAVAIVSCITIIVITLLLWLSHKELYFYTDMYR